MKNYRIVFQSVSGKIFKYTISADTELIALGKFSKWTIDQKITYRICSIQQINKSFTEIKDNE